MPKESCLPTLCYLVNVPDNDVVDGAAFSLRRLETRHDKKREVMMVILITHINFEIKHSVGGPGGKCGRHERVVSSI